MEITEDDAVAILDMAGTICDEFGVLQHRIPIPLLRRIWLAYPEILNRVSLGYDHKEAVELITSDSPRIPASSAG
jgi:hypothetical protein